MKFILALKIILRTNLLPTIIRKKNKKKRIKRTGNKLDIKVNRALKRKLFKREINHKTDTRNKKSLSPYIWYMY